MDSTTYLYKVRLFLGRCLLAGLLVSQAMELKGQSVEDTLNITHTGRYQLYKHLQMCVTGMEVLPAGILDSLDKGRFKPYGDNPSVNDIETVTSSHWLVMNVKNSLSYDESFFCWFNSPGLDRVRAWRLNRQQRHLQSEGVSGFSVPFHQRQNKSIDAEFQFRIKHGETAVFLIQIENADGQNAFFTPELADAATFYAMKSRYFLIIGIISGIMIISIFMNIFFAVALKEKLHYLYAAYLFFIFMEILIMEGLASTLLTYYVGTALADVLTHINPAISGILMTWVMQWFLEQRKDNSRMKRPADIGVCCLFAIIIIYLLDYPFGYGAFFKNILQVVLVAMIGIQLLLVIASAVEKAWQRSGAAYLYLIATIFPLAGIFEHLLLYMGFDQVTEIKTKHPNNMEVGLVLESLIVFLAIIYRYNLYKKEKERLLIQLNEEQRSLINRIVSAEEAERKRIAKDLHDDVAATLNTLSLHVDKLPENYNDKQALMQYYNKSVWLSKKAMSDIRDIAHNLLPADFKTNGLFKTLTDRVYTLNQTGNMHIGLIMDGDESRIGEETAIIVYRIINELLTNISKHSSASQAALQVFIELEILIMVEDNGSGFDSRKASAGMGLSNIGSRVEFLKGHWHIDSGPKGTNIIIQLPILAVSKKAGTASNKKL